MWTLPQRMKKGVLIARIVFVLLYRAMSGLPFVRHGTINQFILIDRHDRILSPDHGDGYPRAALLKRYSAKAGAKNFDDYDNWVATYFDNGGSITLRLLAEEATLATFPGAIGKNDTGCGLGGLSEVASVGSGLAFPPDLRWGIYKQHNTKAGDESG